MSGLIRGKFIVQHHVRGSLPEDEPFVLVPGRDPAAVRAMRTYANATPDAALAADIHSWMDRLEGACPSDPPAITPECIHAWTAVLAREVHCGTMAIETALQRIAGFVMGTMKRLAE